ncbi:ABC transporter permease subunit [Geomicrobium sp. JCM 19055]|uniref:ABC transporter permease subunit n=1 Tax=Geomicrobium sp. JCM 19055 TaxID=1460649 RepID=UPI00351C2A2C
MVINPQAFIDVIPFLIDGLWITLYITIFGVAIGCVIGTLFGLMSISRFRIVRFIAVTYVEIVRGTPLLAQIFFYSSRYSGSYWTYIRSVHYRCSNYRD